MLTCLVTQLLLWDLWFKLLQSVSRPALRRSMDRNVSEMARRLVAIVKTYGRLRFEMDPALRHEPPKRTVVCANHQSVSDIAVILAALPNHHVRFVAKKELSRGFPAVSEVLRNQGHALIDRKGDMRSVAVQLKQLGRSIDRGITPALFPEGTRSRDGSVGPFHAAGVRNILSSKPVPITAIAVDGGQRFVSLGELRGITSKDHYRVKLVGVFHHNGSKSEITAAVEAARSAVVAQIERWRAQDRNQQGMR